MKLRRARRDIRRHVSYKPTNNRNKYICICKNKKNFEFILSGPENNIGEGQDRINITIRTGQNKLVNRKNLAKKNARLFSQNIDIIGNI